MTTAAEDMFLSACLIFRKSKVLALNVKHFSVENLHEMVAYQFNVPSPERTRFRCMQTVLKADG